MTLRILIGLLALSIVVCAPSATAGGGGGACNDYRVLPLAGCVAQQEWTAVDGAFGRYSPIEEGASWCLPFTGYNTCY